MTTSGIKLRIGLVVLALGASLFAVPAPLDAQRSARIARVGRLEVCSPGSRRLNFDVFKAHLAELGYVECKNLVIEQRFADCRYDRIARPRRSSSTLAIRSNT